MNDRKLAAVAAWGAELRASRNKHRRMVHIAVAVAGLACALASTIVSPPRPLFVWNVSESAPIGLYGVNGSGGIARGDMVIARLPEQWRLFAARRRYVPANVPLVKRVAAVPGDQVCASGSQVRINGATIVVRRSLDGQGRAVPAWKGCMTLKEGMHLLLMDSQSSFDGRYFGPSAPGDIIGKAHLL